jgi:prefoldin subunit 5
MSRVSQELLEIAQRIAGAENRVSTLAARIERLREEGSDVTQAQDLLDAARQELNQLYVSQVSMRRQSWLYKSAA